MTRIWPEVVIIEIFPFYGLIEFRHHFGQIWMVKGKIPSDYYVQIRHKYVNMSISDINMSILNINMADFDIHKIAEN